MLERNAEGQAKRLRDLSDRDLVASSGMLHAAVGARLSDLDFVGRGIEVLRRCFENYPPVGAEEAGRFRVELEQAKRDLDRAERAYRQVVAELGRFAEEVARRGLSDDGHALDQNVFDRSEVQL